MDELIFLLCLFSAIISIIILSRSRKRYEKLHNDLNSVLSGIDVIKESASSNNASLRSLISKNEQKQQNNMSKLAKNNEGRIGCLEDRVINEIQTFSGELRHAIQQSHSGLSKSLKGKLGDMGTELTELHKELRECKDDILRTQAQSFSGVEVIRNEEHKYIEREFQTVNMEQANVRKYVQDVTEKINDHLTSIKPIEELLGRLNTLYNNLVSLDKDILSQEKSLNGMVEEHTKILEYTHELQQTSEEIFDMMKLMLIDAVVKQTTPNK